MQRIKSPHRSRAKIEIVRREPGLKMVTPGSEPTRSAPSKVAADRSLEVIEAVRVGLSEPEGNAGGGDDAEVIAQFRRVLFDDVYLVVCPDVAAAVASGDVLSGLAHWLRYGGGELAAHERDVSHVPDAATVLKRAEQAGLLPATMQAVMAVTDWGDLLQAFAEGRAYVPRPVPTPVEARARPVHPSPSAGSMSVIQTVTPGLEQHYAVAPQVVAFYLPQYHRVKENDEWWGEGFTEWTNVRRAKKNFEGHFQPRVPQNGDYYDLTQPGVQKRQTAQAREYGIRAFCYYLYWFDGRRLLERPLDQMLEDTSIDHEFCVCWANENWTRTWDGKAGDVLLGQVHTPDSDRRFIQDAMKYLRDPRYMRIDGKLALLVYRVDLLPNAAATAEIWRNEVRQAGLGDLHLCAVQFYGITDPAPWGFDAAVEFPPHGWLGQENLLEPQPTLLNPEFTGYIFDYDKAVDWALSKPIPEYRWYRGAFPGWDNTARRQHTPHIFANSNPFSFERWMTGILRQTVIMAPPEHQVVFVNAWNEWGEGAHLEPDEAGGLFNLMALNSALRTAVDSAWVLALLGRLRTQGDYPGRTADELALLNHLRGHEQAIRALSDRLRATGTNPYL